MSLKLGTTDISGVPTALINTVNNKLDASTYTSNPRTNAVYITQTYHNGASWYRVWSDGFIEQGGVKSAPSTTSDSYQISLNKSLSTYCTLSVVASGPADTSTGNVSTRAIFRAIGHIIYSSVSSTSFSIQAASGDRNYYWYACGY